MTILKKYEEKDFTSPDEELEQRSLEYMRQHPGVAYLQASNIVLEADPELAKAYAGKDEKKEYANPAKKAKTEYQRDLAKSAEHAKKAEEYMYDHPEISYMEASDIVSKTDFK